MKIEWNKKYTTISAYVLIVMTIAILIFQFFDNITYFRNILDTIFKLMMPFIYGFIFAYVFHPVLKWLETKALPYITKKKLSARTYRSIGILLTIIFAIALILLFSSFIIPELIASLKNIVSQITDYISNLENYLTTLFTNLKLGDTLTPIITKILNSMERFLNQMFDLFSESLSSIINTTINATINITSTVINIFVGIVISVYLWSSKETFFAQLKKLSYAFLPSKFVDRMIVLLCDTNKIFSGFISGKLLDSLIIGALCYLGMVLLGIPYALLISVIVGVTNIIPYFGPFIGAIPSILLLLMVDPIKALWFAIFILVLQQVDGNIIGPKILGDSTGLPAFWVIFAVTVFGGVLGFGGMLIGVPLFAVIYMLIRHAVNLRLQNKQLPTDTEAFASEANPILHKIKRIKNIKNISQNK